MHAGILCFFCFVSFQKGSSRQKKRVGKSTVSLSDWFGQENMPWEKVIWTLISGQWPLPKRRKESSKSVFGSELTFGRGVFDQRSRDLFSPLSPPSFPPLQRIYFHSIFCWRSTLGAVRHWTSCFEDLSTAWTQSSSSPPPPYPTPSTWTWTRGTWAELDMTYTTISKKEV